MEAGGSSDAISDASTSATVPADPPPPPAITPTPTPTTTASAPRHTPYINNSLIATAVNAVIANATQSGNHIMANVVTLMYAQSQTDPVLAALMEAIVKQKATPEQIKEFQDVSRRFREENKHLDLDKPGLFRDMDIAGVVGADLGGNVAAAGEPKEEGGGGAQDGGDVQAEELGVPVDAGGAEEGVPAEPTGWVAVNQPTDPIPEQSMTDPQSPASGDVPMDESYETPFPVPAGCSKSPPIAESPSSDDSAEHETITVRQDTPSTEASSTSQSPPPAGADSTAASLRRSKRKAEVPIRFASPEALPKRRAKGTTSVAQPSSATTPTSTKLTSKSPSTTSMPPPQSTERLRRPQQRNIASKPPTPEYRMATRNSPRTPTPEPQPVQHPHELQPIRNSSELQPQPVKQSPEPETVRCPLPTPRHAVPMSSTYHPPTPTPRYTLTSLSTPSSSRSPATPAPTSDDVTPCSKTAQGRLRLLAVVEGCLARTGRNGHKNIGEAIKKYYDESLTDATRAAFLDDLFAGRASREQMAEFQSFVKRFWKEATGGHEMPGLEAKAKGEAKGFDGRMREMEELTLKEKNGADTTKLGLKDTEIFPSPPESMERESPPTVKVHSRVPNNRQVLGNGSAGDTLTAQRGPAKKLDHMLRLEQRTAQEEEGSAEGSDKAGASSADGQAANEPAPTPGGPAASASASSINPAAAAVDV